MRDYEFRFFQDGAMRAIHMTSIEGDSAACERARLYLKESPEYSSVEVRQGIRFMQRITAEIAH